MTLHTLGPSSTTSSSCLVTNQGLRPQRLLTSRSPRALSRSPLAWGHRRSIGERQKPRKPSDGSTQHVILASRLREGSGSTPLPPLPQSSQSPPRMLSLGQSFTETVRNLTRHHQKPAKVHGFGQFFIQKATTSTDLVLFGATFLARQRGGGRHGWVLLIVRDAVGLHLLPRPLKAHTVARKRLRHGENIGQSPSKRLRKMTIDSILDLHERPKGAQDLEALWGCTSLALIIETCSATGPEPPLRPRRPSGGRLNIGFWQAMLTRLHSGSDPQRVARRYTRGWCWIGLERGF